MAGLVSCPPCSLRKISQNYSSTVYTSLLGGWHFLQNLICSLARWHFLHNFARWLALSTQLCSLAGTLDLHNLIFSGWHFLHNLICSLAGTIYAIKFARWLALSPQRCSLAGTFSTTLLGGWHLQAVLQCSTYASPNSSQNLLWL